jgi:hypothetical protein
MTVSLVGLYTWNNLFFPTQILNIEVIALTLLMQRVPVFVEKGKALKKTAKKKMRGRGRGRRRRTCLWSPMHLLVLHISMKMKVTSTTIMASFIHHTRILRC